jgi:hypothetical protein
MPEDKAEIRDKGASKVDSVAGSRFYECPLTITTQETNDIIDLIVLTNESGVLPFPGSWTKQPFWFVESFLLYKKELNRFKKDVAQTAKEKPGKG